MGTFKAYLKKEVMEASRKYRYLLLVFGTVIYAGIMTPAMMKALPLFTRGQMQGNVDLSTLFNFTRKAIFVNFYKDIFQTSSLFVFLGIASMLSDEVGRQRLVFPYSKGISPAGMVLAKVVHYVVVITALIFIASGINYYYGDLLFKGDTIAFGSVMTSTFYISMYYIFFITLLLFLSSLFRHGLAAGFITLFLSYISSVFFNIKALKHFLPYNLYNAASTFSSEGVATTIVVVIVLSIVFVWAAVYRMKRVEVI